MNVLGVLSEIEEIDVNLKDLELLSNYSFNHGEIFDEIKDELSKAPFLVIGEARRALESQKSRLQKALETTEVNLSD